MYLDNLDLLAVCIALIAQMAISIVLFISARKWEQAYRDVIRLLREEQAVRNEYL